MAIRRTLAQFSDEIVAADLADGSITAAKVAADVATQAELDVVSTAVDNVDVSTAMKPHIRTGVLYPSYVASGTSNKLLDGTTAHSGAFGTAQSDGRSYYYTNINGSKPIKDPRIGAHFGSQRHKFKSIQLLEQETTVHGSNVYSIDGREWIRVYNEESDAAPAIVTYNTEHGLYVSNGGTGHVYYEITGYFSEINMLGTTTQYTNRGQVYSIDGAAYSAEQLTWEGNPGGYTPLGSRYVDRHALATIVTGQTLGIHTISIRSHTVADYVDCAGIELIAQDTTSTATKSKIQIPAQNVVSYGKKFSVSATATHYDPFNGFTNGTTLFSANVDTATSLGLGTGTTYGAPWAISSSNHIRPLNGGRVVKWIDSSGAIKTSVTMMPRNAQNQGNNNESGSAGVASNEITTASATNTHTINFSDDVVESSLAEVAHDFHFREFGNGNANGGTSGTYKDASMIAGTDANIAYVMDDGLTGLYANGVYTSAGGLRVGTSESMWWSFIGTGISFHNHDWNGNDQGIRIQTVAQNLPYGTHIVKINRNGSDVMSCDVDGITVYTQPAANNDRRFHICTYISIFQPKMPPIPENAVVIADYMLMADYVANTANGNHLISKGVRTCSHSRDVYYNDVNGFTPSLHDISAQPGMGYLASSSSSANATNNKYSLPAFGTTFQINGHTSQTKNDLFINDTDVDQSGTTAGNHGDISYPDAAVTLGMNKFAIHGASGSSYSPYLSGMGWKIVSPTHTSSHYQTFETPYLHELVGGDRNMEQTNLVVTADGKTWDEVTRDTSYIGPAFYNPNTDTGVYHVFLIFDEYRGTNATYNNYHQKNFAIAYDRHICLVNGLYRITAQTGRMDSNTTHIRIYINGTLVADAEGDGNQKASVSNAVTLQLKRGDYVQLKGYRYNSSTLSLFEIIQLD